MIIIAVTAAAAAAAGFVYRLDALLITELTVSYTKALASSCPKVLLR